MSIAIILRSTNKVEHIIRCKSLEQQKQTYKQMAKDQKRLPNSYNRHKQSRLYCYTKDKHIQQLCGDSDFWFSMYSGRQYIYKIILDNAQNKMVTSMNEYQFIDIHGIHKAECIVENVVYNAPYYSDTTGSYYSTNKNDSISIKALKKAIEDFKEIETLKQKYESKLKDWNKKSVKGLNT